MSSTAEKSKYQFVMAEIRKGIADGVYQEEGKLPGENELARMHSVSLITVRRALSELVSAGEIVRIKGKGTFVKDHLQSQSTSSASSNGDFKVVTLVILDYENADDSMLKIIGGAQSALSKKGYSMVIECSNSNEDKETEILDRCIHTNMNGMLIFPIGSGKSTSKLREIKSKGIPFVLLDRSIDNFPSSLVTSNNVDGTYQMTNYLAGLGHESIAFACTAPGLSAEKERLEGYKTALMEKNLPYHPGLLIEHAYDEMDRLMDMAKKKMITAIVCVNDGLARVVIERLGQCGLAVPGDISVTGFDDSLLGQAFIPPITSVKQQFEKLGRVAAEQLVRAMEKGEGNAISWLPVKLAIRDSARAITKDEVKPV